MAAATPGPEPGPVNPEVPAAWPAPNAADALGRWCLRLRFKIKSIFMFPEIIPWVHQATEVAAAKYPGRPFKLVQDEDVLDTW